MLLHSAACTRSTCAEPTGGPPPLGTTDTIADTVSPATSTFAKAASALARSGGDVALRRCLDGGGDGVDESAVIRVRREGQTPPPLVGDVGPEAL